MVSIVNVSSLFRGSRVTVTSRCELEPATGATNRVDRVDRLDLLVVRGQRCDRGWRGRIPAVRSRANVQRLAPQRQGCTTARQFRPVIQRRRSSCAHGYAGGGDDSCCDDCVLQLAFWKFWNEETCTASHCFCSPFASVEDKCRRPMAGVGDDGDELRRLVEGGGLRRRRLSYVSSKADARNRCDCQGLCSRSTGCRRRPTTATTSTGERRRRQMQATSTS